MTICPICKTPVPFSLAMHMQMAHAPGQKQAKKNKGTVSADSSDWPMNERKPATVKKHRSKKKEPPRRRAY